MDYVLRLQALDGYSNKFDEVFGDRFSRVLCVHHTGRNGNNPHYHFCFTADYKKDALRKYLKGHFNLAKGNRHLSLKDWDGRKEACSYLFHEGTEALISRGFTEEEITEFKEMDTLIQSKMVKPQQVVDKAVEILSPARDPDKRAIFGVLFKIYVDNGEWLPNKFQWERVVNKVRLELARKKGHASLAILQATMFNEIFPYG